MSRVIPALPPTLPNPLRFTAAQLVRSTDWVDMAESVNLGLSVGHVQPVISQEMSHISSVTGTGVWTARCWWRIPILSGLHTLLKVGVNATTTTGQVRWTSAYGGSTLTYIPAVGWTDSNGTTRPHLTVAADPTGEFEDIYLETEGTLSLRNCYGTYLRSNVGGTYPGAADTLPNTIFDDIVAMDTAHLAADKPLDAGMGQELALGAVSHLKERFRSYSCASCIQSFANTRLGYYPHRALVPRMDLISELVVWVRYANGGLTDSAVYIQHGEGDEGTLDNIRERTGIADGSVPAGSSVYKLVVPASTGSTWTRVVLRLHKNRDFAVPTDQPTVGLVSIQGGGFNTESAGSTTYGAVVLGFSVMGR